MFHQIVFHYFSLTFQEHINDKINVAYMMLGLIKRNFKHVTIPTFVTLYKSMVRSHLQGDPKNSKLSHFVHIFAKY